MFVGMPQRAKQLFKRDRETENVPVGQPEVEPQAEGYNALSVAKGVVTEPVLTTEIGGEVFEFMVDTGAMVSLIQPGISKAHVQPCDMKARGVTGTQKSLENKICNL
jgi:predicted aspartyl protease